MGVILDQDALATALALRRDNGKRVVLTNGIFDLLHIGHLRYLCQARALGDLLVVAVNSDAATRRLKGPTRPIVPEAERAELLAALSCVDYVTLFGQDTAEAVIERVRPDTYCKGADYATAADEPPQRDLLLEADTLRRVLAGDVGDRPELAGLGDRLPEARIVAEYGGRLALLGYVPEHSTSALIARIRALPSGGE